MDTKSKKVAHAFSVLVREALERGENVDLPDFGRFYVEHQPAEVEYQPGGQLALKPPRNVVRFDSSL